VATPIYNTSWAGGRQWGPSRRPWAVVESVGSWFGGGTPLYTGPGQPPPDGDSSIGGALAYLAAPPQMGAADDDAATPQPNSVAIVVPRT
jgi:hypothetical protein